MIPALRTWFEDDCFYGCAFVNAAAEHAKGSGGEPWLQVLLVMDGAIAAMMVNGNLGVLAVAGRTLGAVLRHD